MKWVKVATVLAAAACALLPVSASFIERWYSTGLFPRIQRLVTPISNAVPFAVFDVLTVGGVVAVVVLLVRAVIRARQARRLSIVLSALGNLVWGAAVAYLAFLLLWGFNYRRLPMTDRLVRKPAAPTAEAVRALGEQAVGQLNALYEAAHAADETPPWRDEAMRAAFERAQRLLTGAPPAVPGRL